LESKLGGLLAQTLFGTNAGLLIASSEDLV
jgi:hypothetical protein